MQLSDIKGATEKNTCIWKPNTRFNKTWDTSCGIFQFSIKKDWHPFDNKFTYCPFCGRMIFVTDK